MSGMETPIRKLSAIYSKQSLLYLFVCGLTAWPASANGFYGNGVSARSLALGGIYTPSSDNALDALASNPAGLALLAGVYCGPAGRTGNHVLFEEITSESLYYPRGVILN